MSRQYISRFTFLLGITFTAVFSACEGKKKQEDTVVQGRITYELSYPYYDGESVLAALLPREMEMTFKGPKMKIAVHSKKIFSNVIISDERERSLLMLVKMSSRQMSCMMNEAEINDFMTRFPSVEYLKNSKTKEFDGLKAIAKTAVFTDASKEAEIYFTDQIALNNPNWNTPFKAIEGVMLQYEIQKYGLTMRFTAKKVELGFIPHTEFLLPTDYEATPLKDIEKELLIIFSQIQDNI